MKSLLDIQQDIRDLELSVKEITKTIRSLHTDIENIRDSSDIAELDYARIEMLSRQLPFGKHPLNKLEDRTCCKIYLEMLLNIVCLDLESENIINRLVFLQWLQIQSRVNWTLEELYKDCMKRNRKIYYEFAEAVHKKYWSYFMVDALITANIGGRANREILEYIVDLNTILGNSKDSLRTYSLISRIVLQQNVEGISKVYLPDVYQCLENYGFYVSADVIEQVKCAFRDIVVELRDNETKEFKWKVKQRTKVEKGDLIALYKRYAYKKEPCKKEVGKRVSWTARSGVEPELVTEEIKAASSGVIFQFKADNTYYGVIAFEADNKDSIKAWVKANRR